MSGRTKHVVAFLLGVGILLGAGAAIAAQPHDVDPSFGEEGVVTEPVSISESSGSTNGAAITDLAQVDSRGRMAAAVRSWKEGDSFFAVARFQANGSLDPAFLLLTRFLPGD